jgi:V8-like Glu-specific endopeptidase
MSINVRDFKDSALVEAVQRVSGVVDTINTNRKLIREGLGFLSETEERLTAFLDRQQELPQEQVRVNVALKNLSFTSHQDSEKELERKIGSINNILSIEFLELGLLAAQSVGRFTNGVNFATGFHVGNQIIITNNHVIKSRDEAREWKFELNIEDNKIGSAKDQYTYSLDPEKFFLTNKEYDFTLVRLSNSEGLPLIETFGWHTLLDVQGKILIGQPVNIIQHPNGNNKAVVVHDSCLLYLDDADIDMEKYCLYSSDTEEGSSGSPVFNNQWEIVALHHKAIPKTDKNGNLLDKNGRQISNEKDKFYVANEGIRVSRLVKAIKNSVFDNPEETKIRDELIKLWNEPGAHQRGLKKATL